MILIDNYQLIMPLLFRLEATLSKDKAIMTDKEVLNVIRASMLSKYAKLAKQFVKDYKQIYICTEGGNSWRKDKYPFYKANRAKLNSPFWDVAFSSLLHFEDEIHHNVYPVIKLAKTEADDIIGTLAIEQHKHEKILIVSGDKDFTQLLYYPNIDIYNTNSDKMVQCQDPVNFLAEQIIRGDASDGIPNILNPTNILINRDANGKQIQKQKPVTKSKLEELKLIFIKGKLIATQTIENRFNINEELIDLHKVPNEHKLGIFILYDNLKINYANHVKPFNYLLHSNSKLQVQDLYGGFDSHVYLNL